MGKSVGVWGFYWNLWEGTFVLRELKQAPQPKVTFVTVNLVLMTHDRLLVPETHVLSFSLEGVSQDLEQQFSLSPCYALSPRWREGSPVTACNEVLHQLLSAKVPG